MTSGAAAGIQYPFSLEKILGYRSDAGGEVVVVVMLEFIPLITESINGIFLAFDFKGAGKIFSLFFPRSGRDFS